jgi:hypothetical protein
MKKAEKSQNQSEKGYKETMHDEDTGLLFIGWLVLLTYITLLVGDYYG